MPPIPQRLRPRLPTWPRSVVECTAEAAESSRSSVTQALPLVRRDGTGEPPSVRAVARRVPSALPALGRDEIIDAPHSARITADRRRRAVAVSRFRKTTPSRTFPQWAPPILRPTRRGSDVSHTGRWSRRLEVMSVGTAKRAADR